MEGIVERILIVDDQLEVRELIMMLFEDEPDVECFVAEDGAHAIEILKQFQIHAIVTDIKMPNIDGVELCQKIRKYGYEGSIIVVTGEATGEQYRQLCQLQISEVFLKPVDIKILKKSLMGALHSQILNLVEKEALSTLAKEQQLAGDYLDLSPEEKVSFLLPYIEKE